MAKVLLHAAALFLLLLGTTTFVESFIFGDNPFAQPLKVVRKKPDFETSYAGEWKLATPNAGVSAMHLAITRTNKAIMFDSTIMMVPPLKLQPGNCRPVPKSKTNEMDCSVHAVEYDLETGKSRPLKVRYPGHPCRWKLLRCRRPPSVQLRVRPSSREKKPDSQSSSVPCRDHRRRREQPLPLRSPLHGRQSLHLR
ncbi:aldehyde oxidase GLOX1-like [Canna indica]|uniref:Aldehyde oxidase GLOX1-like n=1 Tax=Canna indica TaxID=4628 RepID=A0AAQ3K1C5_9LILI|nr:aldehyde oxidase GLOX1-like [Canna indica]WOK99284.1 aldehyde oxidase GLOX1-like [Canna indica]